MVSLVGPGQFFVKKQSCKAVFQGHPVCMKLQNQVCVDICQLCGNACSAKILALTGVQGPNCKGLGLNRELFWANAVVCRRRRRRRRWRLTMTMIRSLVRSNWGQTAWFIALPCSHPPFLFLRDCNELGAVEQCNCIGNCMRASYYEGSRIVLRSTWRWVVNTYIDKVFKSNPAKYFDSVHFVVAWNSNDLPERQVLAIRPLVAVFLFMLIPPHPSDCRGILYLKEYWDLTLCWKKSGGGIPTTLSLLLLIMAMASLMASLADGGPGVLKRSHRRTTRD